MSGGRWGGFSTATDVADYLVRKGLTFRQAHEVVGRLVRHCIEQDCDVTDLPLDRLREFSTQFAEDVYLIDVDSSVRARDVPGGTAPNRVKEAIAEGMRMLSATESWCSRIR